VPGADNERPRIGLVLSGGGAKGTAHVGVIQVLERLGIQPDLVVGTSMGAVVGGLYASGLSGEELERAVREIDWIDIFDDTPPRVERSLRSKEDDAKFQVRYRLGIKDGEPQLPQGLILGQKLTLALRKFSTRSYTLNFDDLRIPFGAVATDLETGNVVVLKSGSLALAMRASMSAPEIFPPVEYEGRLLVDGGIADNLPVDVARAFGADTLIVVNVQTRPNPREKINSALSVVEQSIGLLFLQQMPRQLALLRPADVLIEPELGDIGTGDFLRTAEAVEAGKVAAQAAAERLAALTRKPDTRSPPADGPTSPTKPPPIITAIRIDNDTPLADEVIRSRLRVREGQPLDLDALEKDLSRIYGLDYFETVDYTLTPREPGTGELDIIARKKHIGLDNFRFGFNLESDFDGDSLFNLDLEYNMTGLNRLGAEWRNELIFGDRLRVATDFYQPLDFGFRWFVEPQARYDERNVRVFADGRRLGEYRVKGGGGGAGLGRQFGTCCDVRSGILFGRGTVDVHVGRLPPAPDFTVGSFLGAAKYDTLDHLPFPRQGALGAVVYLDSTKALGADPESKRILFGGLLVRSWNKNTFLLRLNGGVTLTGAGQIQDLFPLGGFLNLSGFSEDELAGKNAALTSLGYYRRIHELGFGSFAIPLYVGGSLEYGGVYEDSDEFFSRKSLVAGAAFLGADTPFGPLYLGYGIAEQGNRQAYLALGEIF